MIGYLQGEILDHSEGKLLLGVGDPNAGGRVGYTVSVPQSPPYRGLFPGQKIELFVYTHVREEALDLYGFSTPFEKAVFLTLLTVNGIGPKGALGILTGMDPAHLLEAILEGDQASLTRAPGIGKKTAERVVVELKDVIQKKFGSSGPSVSSGRSEKSAFRSHPGIEDAKLALIGLGYREQEVQQVLSKLLDGSQPPLNRTEDWVRSALKHL